jgi:hypothetical protein
MDQENWFLGLPVLFNKGFGMASGGLFFGKITLLN